MPTFDTPEPIKVTIDLVGGDVRITASERTDTLVEVRPSDANARDDVRAAEQTLVEYADGRLLIKAPKNWRRYSPFGHGGAVDVTVKVPLGSHVDGTASVAAFRGTGRLGDCRVETSTGDVRFERANTLDLTATGSIEVDNVIGAASASTSSGRVRLHHVDGPAVIKNSNGDSLVGEITGALRVNNANGHIAVGTALSDVTAATANGDIRVGSVERGATSLKTACGELEVGIREGTSAWLDLHTQFGDVHNRLDTADAPSRRDDAVEVRARTSYGDIVIHRAPTNPLRGQGNGEK